MFGNQWTAFLNLLQRIRRSRSESDQSLVDRVLYSAKCLQAVSDREIRNYLESLRDNVLSAGDVRTANVLEGGLALVVEGVRRALGIELYPVQVQAGIALTRGHVAEMATGEGKTLTAALPAVMHALKGRGVHVATSNHYLAERDWQELSPVYELLGLTSAFVSDKSTLVEKRAAYATDITYAAGHEFGFDYLRDQIALRGAGHESLGAAFRKSFLGYGQRPRLLQRGLAFTIVDEIDNVMLDDAISPLLLSAPTEDVAPDAAVHDAACQFVRTLEIDQDFRVVHVTGEIQLTATGVERAHAKVDDIPVQQMRRPWLEYVRQALRAHHIMSRDVHYVISEEGDVRIVDESTGRIFEDRSWNNGLHQAVEAKEGMTITGEKKALARVTRQRFFRLYEDKCGMTGTATGSEAEFRSIYGLDIVPIPLRCPTQRTMLPTRYFPTAESKWKAIADDVHERQRLGQPVLIGTRSIQDSESLSQLLHDQGIDHQVLNGRQDADEAEIIRHAGNSGTVTIATNLAGRGTDIKPSPKALAKGGLHVVGAARHRSRRIDRQLVGRSARQGDPGSAQFFVSAEDELLVRDAPRLSNSIANSTGRPNSQFDKSIQRVQQGVERRNARQRQLMLQADLERDTTLAKLWGHAS